MYILHLISLTYMHVFRAVFDQINIVINDVWHTCYFPILFSIFVLCSIPF